jgi:rubredoxin
MRSIRFEAREDIECPDCGLDIPIHAEVCPHCEVTLN